MTNRFLVSVAALALIAGTGFANAQGTGTRQESGGGQQMQHNAQPSTGGAERGSMGKEEGSMGKQERGTVGQAGDKSMKSGQSTEDRSSGAMKKNESAEEKGATKGQRTNEHVQGQTQGQSKGMSTENETRSGQKDMKSEGRESREGRTGATTGENRQGQTGTNVQGRTETTGQAGAGAKLSTEQRTQITSVIREEHVAPARNVNFSIAVGTRVPREGIELHALPSRVVSIYPEWRSYKYILVRDEIVVIDPETFEIVAVLNA